MRLDTNGLRQRLAPDGGDVVIIYDGQCIFCQSYVRLLRLRDACGEVRLIDARGDGLARRVQDRLGLGLDEGMLLLIGGQGYHGSEAMHVLSAMTSRLGLLNRLVAWTFRNPGTTRLLYPILKAGRSATLFLLRRPRISFGDDDPGIGMPESNR